MKTSAGKSALGRRSLISTVLLRSFQTNRNVQHTGWKEKTSLKQLQKYFPTVNRKEIPVLCGYNPEDKRTLIFNYFILLGKKHILYSEILAENPEH